MLSETEHSGLLTTAALLISFAALLLRASIASVRRSEHEQDLLMSAILDTHLQF